jgi:scyllo-inositol 2-dehydrogenase (NADP+)
MSATISTGLIGFGLAGKVFHAPLLNAHQGFHVKKISTSDPKKKLEIKERYPVTEVVETYQEIIKDPSIELVVVASPNEFHFRQAKEALLSGKHVVVDKPFCITSAEAAELFSIAAEKSRTITAFQNRRWDSDFLTVQKTINSGDLGRIVEAEISYNRFRNTIRPDTWKEESRPGAGILYDLGSHVIDQSVCLFGTPLAVSGFLAKQRNGSNIYDSFDIFLHYTKLKVRVRAGMLIGAKLPRYIVLGDKGSFVKYGMDVQEAQLQSGMSPHDAEYGIEPEIESGVLRIYSDPGETDETVVATEKGIYLNYYEDVYKNITEDKPLALTSEQILTNIRIIELAQQSSIEGKKLPFN